MAEAIVVTKVSGIYAIVNLSNGKRYVGSSADIQKRWRVHRRDLKNSNHHSVKLQRAFEKYGAENLDFQILEHVPDKAQLEVREQYWIDFYQASTRMGYNLCPVAGNCSGLKASEETKQKMRAAQARLRLAKTPEYLEELERRRKQRVAEFDARNRDARAEYFRKRRLLKREEIAKKTADRYRKNREEVLEKSRAYYYANQQEKIEYARERRRALRNGNAQEATQSC